MSQEALLFISIFGVLLSTESAWKNDPSGDTSKVLLDMASQKFLRTAPFSESFQAESP